MQRLILTLITPILALAAAHTPRDWKSVEPGLWLRAVRYTISLPENTDPAREYPVLIAFPPGDQGEKMVEQGLRQYWEEEARKRGWVVVSPIAPGGEIIGHVDAQTISRLMDDVAMRVRVESGVFHLAGISNGGRSAFSIAAANPERIASVLAVPGYAEDADMARLAGAKDLRIMVYVGEKDPTWRAKAERTRDLLRDAGKTCVLNEVPGSDHIVEVTGKSLFDELEKCRVNAKERAGAKDGAANARARAEVSAALDRLHMCASKAEESAYFDLYTPEAIFLGTDPDERWSVTQFRAYAKKAFENGKGWTYHPVERAVRVAQGGNVAWFDESLDHAKYGRCRGSGVMVRCDDGAWRIEQYNLSVPIPNDRLSEVVGLWGKK